jgi:hypothetical protein
MADGAGSLIVLVTHPAIKPIAKAAPIIQTPLLISIAGFLRVPKATADGKEPVASQPNRMNLNMIGLLPLKWP